MSTAMENDLVLKLAKVSKSFGPVRALRAVDFELRKGEIHAIAGENGAGKSTLLKLIAGDTKPDQGTVALGSSVKMGYFAQHSMDLLDGEDTIFESLDKSFPQAGQPALRTLAEPALHAVLAHHVAGALGHVQEAIDARAR